MTLTIGDIGIIFGLYAVPITVVMFWVKGLSVSQERRIESIDRRIQSVEQEKVSSKDWIRVAMSQQNRQQRVENKLGELCGKVDMMFGISGQIKRVADALQHKETNQR